MNKTKLYAVLISLIFSLKVFAIGLGDMTVSSSLDQPFDAEIALIDVGDIPLSAMKANLAEVDDYERAGLERSFALNTLTFVIERNRQGRPVIHLRSIDRISEPFLQLLIDLAWAKGQIYRGYDVLLDPPDYQLAPVQQGRTHMTKHHLKKKRDALFQEAEGDASAPATVSTDQTSGVRTTYGPTLAGETIWQVAQRYKTPGLSLPQWILAIVGMNQDAFTNENLNGLKVDVQLVIPSTATVGRVPFTEAKQEVEAHDKAWQLKQPIMHVLLPPYIKPPLIESEIIIESHIPSAPVFARPMPLSKQYLSASEDTSMPIQPGASHLERIGTALKAQMDVTVQAIDSLRESNALLKDQLHAMHSQNKSLQGRLKQRDVEMKSMHAQIELLMRRQGLAGQVIQSSEMSQTHHWLLWLLVLLGAAGGGYMVWRQWGTPDVSELYHWIQSRIKPSLKPVIPTETTVPPESVEPQVTSEVLVDKAPVEPSSHFVEDTTAAETKPVMDAPEIAIEPSTREEVPVHNLIEFETTPVSESEEESSTPVRSKSALETLLTIAQTYIEMGDIEAAHESLKEVLEHGNKKQQAAAAKLMAVLDGQKGEGSS